MIKTFIKETLRESLLSQLAEKSKNTPETKSDDEDSDKEYGELSPKEKKKVDTQTIEIRQAIGPGKSLKISQAIVDANLTKGKKANASERGEYTQKVFGRNDRHLKPKEASSTTIPPLLMAWKKFAK